MNANASGRPAKFETMFRMERNLLFHPRVASAAAMAATNEITRPAMVDSRVRYRLLRMEAR